VLGTFLGVIGVLVFTAFASPGGPKLSTVLDVPAALAVASLAQYIQVAITGEKQRRTFSFLRSLPVSDGQIIGAKVAVVSLFVMLTQAAPTLIALRLLPSGVTVPAGSSGRAPGC
jgi:hypothetical protein